MPAGESDDLAQEQVGAWAKRFYYAVRAANDATLRPYGLGLTQWAVMEQLATHGPTLQRDIARALETADAVALHGAAVDAAVEAGVGRILYTSHQGASPDTPFGPGRDHAATEALLAASGLPWTSLRNGFYLHSLAWLLGRWRETGVIAVPGDGPVSWTARADAAEGAAAILRSGGAYSGPITLTASSALTFEEIAVIATEATGRSIDYRALDADEWLADQAASGTPEFIARFTLGMFQAAAGGYFAGTDPLLGSLLGREPRTVHDELAALTS